MGTTARVLEVAAVVATGVLHLLVSNVLGLLGPFIATALLGWGTYAVVRVRRDRSILKEWGFRCGNLRPTFVATSLFAIVSLLVMAAIGHSRGTLTLHWHILLLLVAYPLWGLVQQFLVQALVARNLQGARPPFSSTWFIVPFCALLFGLVHIPDPTLVLATLSLGLVFTPIYLRWRNLWPLGLFHGWLGALCYFWVIGRDPLLEILG
ncbi:MAG: CPBP family glutamic-type intramembrane protease [Planctomycetota bacterium]|jgi:hypothetical protein